MGISDLRCQTPAVDVYNTILLFVLHSNEKKLIVCAPHCVFSVGDDTPHGIVERLRSSTDNARFECWVKIKNI